MNDDKVKYAKLIQHKRSAIMVGKKTNNSKGSKSTGKKNSGNNDQGKKSSGGIFNDTGTRKPSDRNTNSGGPREKG